MLFHMNTEVFAYNSIKNRHEILVKSLYAYRLCSKFKVQSGVHLQRLHKLTDDVAIDQWRHQQCAVPVHTTRQLVNVMHSGLVHTLLHH